LSQLKRYHPPGNLKLIFLGISQSLKLRISMGKILSISLELNFTPNTLGCSGLIGKYSTVLMAERDKAAFVL